MADWYCDDTNGDDANAGSPAAPFATLQKAIDSGASGDTFHVANTSAMVLASALTWNTGYTASPLVYPTTIRAWDNGGALTVTTPQGTRVAAKLDASGLSVDWLNGSAAPFYLLLQDLIIDSSTAFDSANGKARAIALGCEFVATAKTGGYHTRSFEFFIDCTIRDYGIVQMSNAGRIVGCAFIGQSAYAVNGTASVSGCLFVSPAVSTAPLVYLGTAALFSGCSVISTVARTGPLLQMPGSTAVIESSVFQGASGVGGKGLDLMTQAVFVGGNAFHNCTTDEVNNSRAIRAGSDSTSGSVAYTDVGGNNWQPTSDAVGMALPQGYIGTGTARHALAGAIQKEASEGSGSAGFPMSRIVN